MIQFYKHNLNKNKNYLKNTLNSSYLTSGPVCEKVELLLCKKFKKKYSILTNSWTNGLISILMSLNLKPKDEVIIPACTFVACANVVEMVGAKIIFADIDPSTKLMDLDDCLKKITKNTKAILAVHMYSGICNLKNLRKICKKNNLFLIEDCAESAGAKDQNGNLTGTVGDISCWSFQSAKQLTCGDGGMLATNKEI